MALENRTIAAVLAGYLLGRTEDFDLAATGGDVISRLNVSAGTADLAEGLQEFVEASEELSGLSDDARDQLFEAVKDEDVQAIVERFAETEDDKEPGEEEDQGEEEGGDEEEPADEESEDDDESEDEEEGEAEEEGEYEEEPTDEESGDDDDSEDEEEPTDEEPDEEEDQDGEETPRPKKKTSKMAKKSE